MLTTACTLLFLALFCSDSTANPPVPSSDVEVDEAGCRLDLSARPAKLKIPVVNRSDSSIHARLKLEFLSEKDAPAAAVEVRVLLTPGNNAVTATIDLDYYTKTTTRCELLFYSRLKYSISSTAGRLAFGQVAVARIAPALFVIRVVGFDYYAPGSRYITYVKANHPVTREPQSGVSFAGTMELPADHVVKTTATTNQQGEAELSFVLPEGWFNDKAEVKLVARKGEFSQEAEESIYPAAGLDIAISTDKPLYQPGQKLGIRIFMRNPQTRKAVADTKLRLRIVDSEHMLLHEAHLTTSRFGVAPADWTIPDTSRLGDYWIRVSLDTPERQDLDVLYRFRVTRYDLPNFTVVVKPDRPYYLPGQDATIDVEARYLFGKPVANGHVRIVEESDREWNYREQKWEVEEGDSKEGETDSAGRFSATLELKAACDELDKYHSHYANGTYSVYFTDKTTGKTEQRRVVLRVSKHPIHVYIQYARQNRNLPWDFYVSTCYADGTPAECSVDLRVYPDDPDPGAPPVAQTRIRTNKYGIGRLTGLRIDSVGGEDHYELKATATDRSGLTGDGKESVWVSEDPCIRVLASTIQRRGTPLNVRVLSDLPDTDIVLTVSAEGKIIRTQRTRLVAGQAHVSFPYEQALRRKVLITAFSFDGFGQLDYGRGAAGVKMVLYPGEPELKLDVKTDRLSYRPGDRARAAFRVLNTSSKVGDFLIGVAGIDQAVEERARTIREFEQPGEPIQTLAPAENDNEAIAGISLRRILSMTPERITPELSLLAGALVTFQESFYVRAFETITPNPEAHFQKFFKDQFKLIDDFMTRSFDGRFYPKDAEQLELELNRAGLSGLRLEDPWGKTYRISFYSEGDRDKLAFISSGPDEIPDTPDEALAFQTSWRYFYRYGEEIDAAQGAYHKRTGAFIRDAVTLKSELRERGVDFDSLRDPWDNGYELRFGMRAQYMSIDVLGHGNSVEKQPDCSYPIWNSLINYWTETEDAIKAALSSHFEKSRTFPKTEDQLLAVLRSAGITSARLVDGWKNPVYAVFTSRTRYTDKLRIRMTAPFGQAAKPVEEAIPITQQVGEWRFVTRGADGLEGTQDDYTLSLFTQIVAEHDVPRPAAPAGVKASPPASPGVTESRPKTQSTAPLAGNSGGIEGVVKDQAGAVVPGVTVRAVEQASAKVFEAGTNESGFYSLVDLPPGFYTVQFELPGFKQTSFTAVPVRERNITQLDAVLSVGDVAETVTVNASPAGLELASAHASITEEKKIGAASLEVAKPLSTPRVRQYFPETLLWYPELQVARDGTASLDFQLPDNLTTWKISAIASNPDGAWDYQEIDFETFQPFFVEPDPPQFLTQGDQIDLPAVVRNYLASPQDVAVKLDADRAVSREEPETRTLHIAANESVPVSFRVRAQEPATGVTTKVTAWAGEASDAAAKQLDIRPDGREEGLTEGTLTSVSSILEFEIPPSAIPGTARAELRLYPDIGSHIVDAITGVQTNPNGCPEQIISSTYPTLLLLQLEKRGGSVSQELKTKALKDLARSCVALTAFSKSDGGFGYWHSDSGEPGLTAYAVRFLASAREFVPVDLDVLQAAARSLLESQLGDGRWREYWFSDKEPENRHRSIVLTAYVTRTLAELRDAKELFSTAIRPGAKEANTIEICLKRAMEYLKPNYASYSDPYVIACYAQSAIRLEASEQAQESIALLMSLGRRETAMTYWNLETNSVFWGWGLAGRIETTALAVQALELALQKSAAGGFDPARLKEQLNGGAQFLLRMKDRHCIWLTGQATALVLEGLAGILPSNAPSGMSANGLSIRVNGKLVPTIDGTKAKRQTGGPLHLRLSEHVGPGLNRLEFVQPDNGSANFALLASSWYEPWSAARSRAQDSYENSRLELSVDYDRVNGHSGDEVECRVKINRIGFRGYGMLLAEVGLPPGVDVDRQSLQDAKDRLNYALGHYEVLPDRIVFYLWPRAEGLSFGFKFRPRMTMIAKCTRSVVYDYYNPDLRDEVQPQLFTVSR